ncbi:ATP-dependent DNA helicase RecG [Corynebacterium sp. MSK073]|uniref:ATP-dependent DNA helicase RecG n=1 Tax=Corynebacterium sp. MSK073 TaxID=3050198 RepID=UPI00254BC078|nr:ATP-dependent DNA helicase RecG [Corynebacterium sp. MSK073]MDK8814629.1 ATP-dependent DNA helicase RecG [Corynebacterium sp. MSK073]
MLGWQDDRPLTDVLEKKDATKITKALGYKTCGELLAHYPRDYIRHNQDVGLGDAAEGDIVTVTGTVTGITTRDTGKTTIINVQLDGHIVATFFNAMYVLRMLHRGQRVMMSGKLKYFRQQPQLQQPDFVEIDAFGRPDGELAAYREQAPTAGKKKSQKATGSLRNLSQFGRLDKLLLEREWIPVYPATAKITSWYLMGAIHYVLAHTPTIREPLDQQMIISLDQAVREIHEPGAAGPQRAIQRLKYNEALSIGLVMALRQRDAHAHTAPTMPAILGGFREELLTHLPFELTQGQRRVITEIDDDLSGSLPMMRLLQGEVGSGKTMVATCAMLQAIDAGSQAALLAPTEVLASQHAASIGTSVPEGVKVVLLTGSMRTAEKRQALLDIVSGEANIVIGTHAIIQESVEFFDLGLVIVDEQHRFGVEQRDSLRSKTREGISPHVLVMTATPIPRTIAMTIFGDLAVSTLAELPGGRKPIQSAVVAEWRPIWVARALERIREEVAHGHQAYIVCPRIEGEGGVLELAEQLAAGPFKGLRVDILHGKMPNKDEVMTSFARGEIDILVSTTVIEVGVDVPNATVMLIREAENFGVSQLHQLRGRVGRGGNASICLMHTKVEDNSPSYRRITQIAQTSSGFDLAELDLRQRHEGDILGAVQSGTHRTLRLLNLADDQDIVERTHADAYAMVQRNPQLAEELTRNLSQSEQEYLEKN